MEVIGVSSTQHYEWYLGLHAIIGRSKSSTFSGIKSKIWAKINRWKKKKVYFPCRERDFDKGCPSSYANIYHECVFSS